MKELQKFPSQEKESDQENLNFMYAEGMHQFLTHRSNSRHNGVTPHNQQNLLEEENR